MLLTGQWLLCDDGVLRPVFRAEVAAGDERLGAESLEVLVPLCREHHEAVHALLAAEGLCVLDTYVAISRLASRW